MNMLNMGVDSMYESRSNLRKYIDKILPVGNMDDELAKSIMDKMNIYESMNGTLYTAIIHDQICNLLDDYIAKYHII